MAGGENDLREKLKAKMDEAKEKAQTVDLEKMK